MDELDLLELELANIYLESPKKKHDSPDLFIFYFAEKQQFSNRTMSTSGGTVVYGCDSAYGKSADGILKIIQITLGFLAWAMFASLPYYKEVFVQVRQLWFLQFNYWL